MKWSENDWALRRKQCHYGKFFLQLLVSLSDILCILINLRTQLKGPSSAAAFVAQCIARWCEPV